MGTFVSRPKVPEFDIADLGSPAGREGLLCISQSTWLLAYNLVMHYGYWRSRYYKRDAVTGEALEIDDGEWTTVTDYVDLAIEELSMTGCSDFIDALLQINASLQSIAVASEVTAAAAAASAQAVDDQAFFGEVSVGPGEQYPDQGAYLSAKCAVANGIYDTLYLFCNGDIADIPNYAEVGGLTALVGALLLASGPAGWTVGAVSLAVVGIAELLIGLNVQPADVAGALADRQDEFVLALYNSADSYAAKANALAAMSGSSPALTTAESKFLAYLLTSKLTNQLFEPRADLASYVAMSPVDCGAAGIQVWTYAASGQGWAFVDESDGDQACTGQWVAAREAWEYHLVISAALPGAYAAGLVYLDGLAIAVEAGNSVQADYSATSDGFNSFQTLTVVFSDATFVSVSTSGSSSSAGTLTVNMPGSKTIASIEFRAKREVGNYDYTIDLQEVRVL